MVGNDQHWVIKLLVGLIPQKDDDATKLYQWRWHSVALGLATLILTFYALGWIPGVPSPAAMAASVDELKKEFQGKLDTTNRKLDVVAQQLGTALQEQKNGQIRQLNSDLIDARRYQCRAINSADKSALPFWNSRLQELKLSYSQLAGQPWPDLPCNSF